MDINCPVCKQKNIERFRNVSSIYSNKLYALGSCEDCGHIFILNPPDKDELGSIYGTIYNYQAHLAIGDEKQWRFGRLKGVIRKIAPLDARILDIGCGYGRNLNALKAMGYSNLIGIEIDTKASESCRENGFDVFMGEFSEWLNTGIDKTKNRHTCILLSHILEHIRDLDDFFNKVSAFLGSGGQLILMLPNAGSVTARISGRHWGWWQSPVHLHHFTIKSINALLAAKGFKVNLVFTRGADSLFFLSTLFSILRIKPKSRMISAFKRIIIRFNSAIFKYWLFIGDEELIVAASKI